MRREEEITVFRDVPGGPVVWTPHSHGRGSGFGPWWGTKIVYAQRCHQHLPNRKGKGGGQGGLACCSPWGLKESGRTERLN